MRLAQFLFQRIEIIRIEELGQSNSKSVTDFLDSYDTCILRLEMYDGVNCLLGYAGSEHQSIACGSVG